MLMLHRSRTTSSTIAAGFLALVAPCFSCSARGETVYGTTLDAMVTSVYGAIYPNTTPYHDAIDFQTGDGGVLWVDQNVDFHAGTLSNVFTSTKFSSTGGRVSASLLGTDEFLTPVNNRELIVQKFALDNVNLTTSDGSTGGVTLKIQGLAGGNTALSLANSTLRCALIPHFYAPSTLAFSVTGSSQIDGWSGRVGSPTGLDVASGGSFRIKDSGNTATSILSNKLYFDDYGNPLTLDASASISGTSTTPCCRSVPSSCSSTIPTGRWRWRPASGPCPMARFSCSDSTPTRSMTMTRPSARPREARSSRSRSFPKSIRRVSGASWLSSSEPWACSSGAGERAEPHCRRAGA